MQDMTEKTPDIKSQYVQAAADGVASGRQSPDTHADDKVKWCKRTTNQFQRLLDDYSH